MKTPKELNISPPEYPSTDDLLRKVLDYAKATQRTHSDKTVQVVEKLPDNFVKAVINIATSAWRIRSKVMNSYGEAVEEFTKDDIKKVSRYIESVFDALAGIEVAVKDRTGEPFDYGLPEKVVTTLPQPGLSVERVVETLRPTIYWRSQIAQIGEVVIATPQDAPPKSEPVSLPTSSLQSLPVPIAQDPTTENPPVIAEKTDKPTTSKQQKKKNNEPHNN
jgi:hypothetical protein